jgi:hypothetical protein
MINNDHTELQEININDETNNNIIIQDNEEIIIHEWLNPLQLKRNNINEEMTKHNIINYSSKDNFNDKLSKYENAYRNRND